ncbi:hypothetical protein BGW80DRAFT_1335204 [Lactifluus volemus]|nr:hypothetical protein BGW80DRAFT_1335204 [Lactifluus volemus]
MMSRNRSLSWHSMSRTMVRRFGISFFSLIASILMFPMSRTSKTGRNHPSCLVPYSICITSRRLYKMRDVRLETSGIASSHSMLRSRMLKRTHDDTTEGGSEHMYEDREVIDAFTRAGTGTALLVHT